MKISLLETIIKKNIFTNFNRYVDRVLYCPVHLNMIFESRNRKKEIISQYSVFKVTFKLYDASLNANKILLFACIVLFWPS